MTTGTQNPPAQERFGGGHKTGNKWHSGLRTFDAMALASTLNKL
jgi:hypothetical protein